MSTKKKTSDQGEKEKKFPISSWRRDVQHRYTHAQNSHFLPQKSAIFSHAGFAELAKCIPVPIKKKLDITGERKKGSDFMGASSGRSRVRMRARMYGNFLPVEQTKSKSPSKIK